jgi:catechol 2,3-dioxygenase-like lactoylglutathione lyase family enzyme
MPQMKRMSDGATRTLAAPVVDFLFHPTFRVADMYSVHDWLKRVFRRQGMPQRLITTNTEYGFPSEARQLDFSIYTFISDLWFDVTQADLAGQPAISTSQNHLASPFAWYSHRPYMALRACLKHGIGVFSNDVRITDEREVVPTVFGPDVLILYTDPKDVGLNVEICGFNPDKGRVFGNLAYPRVSDPYWGQPPVSADDPLGIEGVSHHTILTDDVARALRFNVEVLGGHVIYESRNDLLRTDSTYVFLADAIIELARPLEPGTPAMEDWKSKPMAGEEDVHHAVTFKVQDLGRTMRHLRAEGIGLEAQSKTLIFTDPKDCLGMRWGFTSASIPNDPRDSRK